MPTAGRVAVAFRVADFAFGVFCAAGFPPVSGFDVLALGPSLACDEVEVAFVELFSAGFLALVGDGPSSRTAARDWPACSIASSRASIASTLSSIRGLFPGVTSVTP